MMKRTDTIIIGAGQCGLAMSQELTLSGVDHVILERGQAGNSWRTERWDSLRLLTPNWMNRLPGVKAGFEDGDIFMLASDFAQRFNQCARVNNAPLCSETTVLSVGGTPENYRVQTDQGVMECRNIVMANGACAKSRIPVFGNDIPPGIQSFTPLTYKHPDQLPQGRVLVVGASASGLQIAREIGKAGHDVTLAVGNHVRVPRTYRGADIFNWLDVTGVMTTPHTEVDDIERVRRTPSLSLMGGQNIDLNSLQDDGVEITGRLAGISDGRAIFSGSLANHCASADLKMKRLFRKIDDWIAENGISDLIPVAAPFEATRIPLLPRLSIDLSGEGFSTIIWATGFRPDFSWLNLPVFDRKGRLMHDGGVVGHGLYVMGLPYLRQRKSTFIDGASEDAEALAAHLVAGFGRTLAA